MLISKRSKSDGFPIGCCSAEKRCEKRLKSRNELLISKLRKCCNLQYIRAPHSTMYCNLQYILDLEIGRSFLLIGLFSSRNFAIHSHILKVSIWSEKWGATANSHILKLSIWNSAADPRIRGAATPPAARSQGNVRTLFG